MTVQKAGNGGFVKDAVTYRSALIAYGYLLAPDIISVIHTESCHVNSLLFRSVKHKMSVKSQQICH